MSRPQSCKYRTPRARARRRAATSRRGPFAASPQPALFPNCPLDSSKKGSTGTLACANFSQLRGHSHRCRNVTCPGNSAYASRKTPANPQHNPLKQSTSSALRLHIPAPWSALPAGWQRALASAPDSPYAAHAQYSSQTPLPPPPTVPREPAGSPAPSPAPFSRQSYLRYKTFPPPLLGRSIAGEKTCRHNPETSQPWRNSVRKPLLPTQNEYPRQEQCSYPHRPQLR